MKKETKRSMTQMTAGPLVNEISAWGPQPGCLGQTVGQETASFLLLRNSVLRQELPPADPTHFPQNIPHRARSHQEEAKRSGWERWAPPSQVTSDLPTCSAPTASLQRDQSLAPAPQTRLSPVSPGCC